MAQPHSIHLSRDKQSSSGWPAINCKNILTHFEVPEIIINQIAPHSRHSFICITEMSDRYATQNASQVSYLTEYLYEQFYLKRIT